MFFFHLYTRIHTCVINNQYSKKSSFLSFKPASVYSNTLPVVEYVLHFGQINHSLFSHINFSNSLLSCFSLGRLHAPLRPMVDVNKRLDADSSTTVSILRYNLLAQDLIHKNMYLYDSHEPDVLSWDYRNGQPVC